MARMKGRFTAESVAGVEGFDVIVTGGNSGIGFEAARVLAAHGARVALACRDAARGEEARARIAAETPGAAVSVSALDLADLGSVRRFAERFTGEHASLEILINNAGVMALPRRCTTADGFEMQLGTNHLGHFALTAALFPLLFAAPSSRVVTVSSLAHKPFRFPIDDPMGERRYDPWRAYAASKLANVYFMRELDRRLHLLEATMMSLACHPGYSATNLTTAGMRSGGFFSRSAASAGDRLLAQSAAQGALPLLYAAASPDARGGTMVGPDGIFEIRGYPTVVPIAKQGLDEAMAARLWALSEELTGSAFAGLPG